MKTILYALIALVLTLCIFSMVGKLISPPASVETRSFWVLAIITMLFGVLALLSTFKAVKHVRNES
ncbi:MAG: hypothetical protein DI585_05655 [Pseudomonas fluorescens]|nr:MAG: hypothetical protein DI585_05655 [Pseudomonas fluorescens]